MAGYNGKHIKTISTATGKKNPFKDDVIIDPEGQWKYPGQVTKIPSGDITMKGIPYPVLGIDNLGNQQMMQPGMDYTFPGQSVTEYPQMAQNGKQVNTLEGDLISKVLMNRNRDKDFVQRAYALGQNPNMFSAPDPDQFGSNMSHKMEWGEDESGQAWMYPSVMNPRNESIKVPNQYADYISSEGYKKATGMKKNGGWLDKYAGGGSPSVEKAKAMLEDGTAHGHPLTQKQRDFFKSLIPEEEQEDFEEYKRGGTKYLRALNRNKTSRNIKTSINFLMARNFDIYGLAGARFYDPNAKFETGGWLDKYK